MGVLWVLACAKPTQAILTLSLRDLGCVQRSTRARAPAGSGITDLVVYVGRTVKEVNEREVAHVVAASLSCESINADSRLVLYPTLAMTGAVRVVAGTQVDAQGSLVRTPAEKCTRGANDSCLRATRAFGYLENETLELPIILDAACIGKVCDEGLTCDGGDCLPEDCGRRNDCLSPGKKDPRVSSDAASSVDASLDGSLDVSLPPADAKPDVITGPKYVFSCSVNGSVAWDPPVSSCVGEPRYCALSNSGVCGTNVCGGAGSYAPCCSRAVKDGGTPRSCCLSAATYHPIEVKEAQLKDVSVCASDKSLCFVGAGDCADINAKCQPVGIQGWGVCGGLKAVPALLDP